MNLLQRCEHHYKHDPYRAEKAIALRKRYFGEGKSESEIRLDAIESRQADFEEFAVTIAKWMNRGGRR